MEFRPAHSDRLKIPEFTRARPAVQHGNAVGVSADALVGTGTGDVIVRGEGRLHFLHLVLGAEKRGKYHLCLGVSAWTRGDTRPKRAWNRHIQTVINRRLFDERQDPRGPGLIQAAETGDVARQSRDSRCFPAETSC